MSEPFAWPIRVYYEDTDASGVAYHARYLHWFERARSEWLRARGFSHQRMAAEFSAAFTVASLEIRYLRPARLDDALEATVTVARQGRASIVFAQTLRAADDAEKPLATATVKVACVDTVSFKPQMFPHAWLEP